ncbi:MAG: hypothetical protein KA436_10840 [Oligoflexales bacterium]|nr:hypothetical protein [Oligoflexales bacterium]
MAFLDRLRRKRENYDIWKAVDMYVYEELGTPRITNKHVQDFLVCDIDKTYLETEFESMLKLAKIAFEDADEKITVEGAAEYLRAYRWGVHADLVSNAFDLEFYPRPLHFVTASPPQLRRVLQEKLALDGLDWSSATFKNQAYNMKSGRWDLLRHQIAYKSSAILGLFHYIQPEQQKSMTILGDNAESDAFIYLGVKLFIEKKLDEEGYSLYLQKFGVEKQMAASLIKKTDLAFLAQHNVQNIYIRQIPSYQLPLLAPLTDPIFLFQDYCELSFHSIHAGLIDPCLLEELARAFHNFYGYSVQELMDLTQSWIETETASQASSQTFLDLKAKLASLGAHAQKGLARTPRRVTDLTQFAKLEQKEILDLAEQWRDLVFSARAKNKSKNFVPTCLKPSAVDP